MESRSAGIEGLVQAHRVHRRVYTDKDIFGLEMERVWGRAWIYVGHESQVERPGDYITTTIGTQPVIMVRDHQGGIQVLHNRCAHKGAKVATRACGHASVLR